MSIERKMLNSLIADPSTRKVNASGDEEDDESGSDFIASKEEREDCSRQVCV